MWPDVTAKIPGGAENAPAGDFFRFVQDGWVVEIYMEVSDAAVLAAEVR